MADRAHSTVDEGEIERFSRIAAEWWDPKGKFAPLHRFNPVRLGFIREQALARFGRDGAERRPFEGLRLLDIGCGGGLLCEPMRRLGFSVTRVDASERKFLKPQEIRGFLAGEPVDVEGPFGVAYEPLSGRWKRSGDCDVNYMMTLTRPAASPERASAATPRKKAPPKFQRRRTKD